MKNEHELSGQVYEAKEDMEAADRLIGAMAVVEKRISAREWGSVRIEGNVWSAIAQDGQDIEPGTAVRVKAIEGVKLIVVPVNGPKGE